MIEDYFRAFFKNSPTAYSFHRVMFDEQGIPYDYELLEINEAYENIMCVKASDVIGKRTSIIYQSVNRQDYSKWDEIIKDAIMNNKSTEVEVPHHSIDKWLRMIVYPLDKDHFACIMADITKEHMQEKEIQGFLNFNLDMLCVSDTDFNVYRVNKKFEDVLGYNIDELEGKSLLALVYKDDLPSTLNEVKKLKENKLLDGFVNRYRCKDGSYKYLEWHCESYGKYYYSSARDVTEKQIANRELFIKTQCELVTRIIENLDAYFARCSYPEFELINLNNEAYNFLKQIDPKIDSLSSIIGRNIYGILHDIGSKKIIKDIQDLSEKNGGSYFNTANTFINGEEKFFKYLIQPLFDIDRKIIEITFLAIDVTEEITAKNRMEETLKVQEEVFANVSHEIRTPLNLIFSTNQLMNLYLKDDSIEENKAKISECNNIIKQNCYRLIRLVNNIIDISKINKGYLELNLSNENIVNVIENIVQSVSKYIKGKGLNIIFDTNTEEKIIACDAAKIEKIILNLISNAIKFSNPDGSIFVNLADKGDNVEISVKDNGIGINKNQFNEIFERFKQVDKSLSRNAEGSGIGLSLVKSLVELHGGQVSVESELGKGSTFKIGLPCTTIKESGHIEKYNDYNRIEIINAEFSDIYSI